MPMQSRRRTCATTSPTRSRRAQARRPEQRATRSLPGTLFYIGVSDASVTRAGLLAGGVALLLPARAAAADPVPDEDLAYARLLIGAELLAADFYVKAVASKKF